MTNLLGLAVARCFGLTMLGSLGSWLELPTPTRVSRGTQNTVFAHALANLFQEENQFPSTLTSLRPSPPRKGSPIHSPFTNPTQTNSAQDSPPTTLPHPPPSVPSPSPSTNPPTNPIPTPTQNPTADHPAKRKRLSKEEKAVKDQEMVKKKEEREADKAAKAADKAKKDAEKAKRDTEKAKKEADRKRRAEEKEKERREKEEEEARKVRSQLKLNSFFKINPATPKPNAAIKTDAVDDASPSGTPKKGAAKETSVYEQVFKPFFIKDQVTVAPVSYLDMDHETKEAKSQILEEYINEKRGHVEVKPFDPVETLQLPCRGRRGRIYPSVRKIMSGFLHDESPPKVIDLSTESQNTQIRQTREALRAVPMKFLGFKQDVRPPYFGTVTNYPSGMASLRRLGRNPLAKDILPLNYDYDSEAEWQEDDGEDVDAMDDDEEDPDNDEDMGDFLDDSEDAGLLRPAFSGGMEPESTGICWESCQREAPLPHMRDFQMEFILGKSWQMGPYCICLGSSS